MGDKKQRKMRNYLLDRRFQLKYTGMVLLVTVSVASGLGLMAYRFSQRQTEALTAQIAAQPDLDAETANDLERFAKQEDRKDSQRHHRWRAGSTAGAAASPASSSPTASSGRRTA